MLKSKLGNKSHKIPRSSPIRKEHMMRKPAPAFSGKQSGSDRPLPMKKMPAPPLKRDLHLMQNKNSTRLRSITSSPHRPLNRPSMRIPPSSIDRSRGIKKHEKKLSPPARHPLSYSSTSPSRVIPPYARQYKDLDSPPSDIHRYSAPLKKKIRREPERYPSRSLSPPARSTHPNRIDDRGSRAVIPSIPMSPERIRRPLPPSHEIRSNSYDMGSQPLPMSKKMPASKSPYHNAPMELYHTSSPNRGYPSSGDKSCVPSLHERFTNVVDSNRSEPRIRYSREDLEKITIDIKRNLRQSPTRRSIINPADVKLVRRANEGRRPIFDRDEIKQAPRDMRDDAYYEKKLINSGGLYNSLHSIDMRDIENYEITRHRFDPHNAAFHSTSGRSLSDRWQNSDGMKMHMESDQGGHGKDYESSLMKRGMEMKNESKSGDRDFRSERYTVRESRAKSGYYDSIPPMPSNSRNSLSVRHKDSLHSGIKSRLSLKRPGDRSPPIMHPESRSRYGPPSEKQYSSSLSVRGEKSHNSRRSSIEQSPSRIEYKKRSESREILPDFSRRPDRYNYKPYMEKSESNSRGSTFFERDDQVTLSSYRGRGARSSVRTSSMSSRGRGFRGTLRNTSFRGSTRGTYKGSPSQRGKISSRRDRYSPNPWEHEMYSCPSPLH